jgi:ATP-dependent Clp protease ATP-binding subunit ClpA
MFERFGRDVREAVLIAAEEATRERGDPRIGTDHLLIGVIAVDESATSAHGIDAVRLRALLEQLDSRALEAVGIDVDLDGVSPRHSLRAGRRWSLGSRNHVPFTSAAKSALHRSLRICVDEGHRRITPSHLLASIVLGGPRDPAVRLLSAAGVDPSAVDAAIRQSWSHRPS